MKRQYWLHPLLLALFPVLSLMQANLHELPFVLVVKPIFYVLGTVFLVWLIVRLFLRESHASSVLVSLWVFLWFSYRHFLDLSGVGDVTLLSIYALVAFLSVLLSHRWKGKMYHLTMFLNVVGITLVVINVVSLSVILVKHMNEEGIDDFLPEDAITQINTGLLAHQKPDVYYLIFDSFARSDIMRDFFDYDDSWFVNGLKERGFYVASGSSSNYSQTALSLASSFNMTYLYKLPESLGTQTKNRDVLKRMLRYNLAVKKLKKVGYEFVLFESGDIMMPIEIADRHVGPDRPHSTQFLDLLIRTTPLLTLGESLSDRWVPEELRPYNIHRDRILYAFDNIPKVANKKSPAFVFSHMIAPHPPFIFKADGSFRQPTGPMTYDDRLHYVLEEIVNDLDGYKERYIEQFVFVAKSILKMIDEIKSNSRVPPIIVLQADHGVAIKYNRENMERQHPVVRMAILNAYYVPSVLKKRLYPSISPINTFRLILPWLTGEDMELYPDYHFLSTWSRPYLFENVIEDVQAYLGQGLPANTPEDLN